MKISDEGIAITKRFFEAIELLKSGKQIRGLHSFTKTHDINYWNICTVRDKPDISVLKPEWINYLSKDYNISPTWVITGEGKMFISQREKTLF